MLRALVMFAVAVAGGATQLPPAERGRQVYVQQKCSTCHQIGGQGNRISPLDGVGSRLSESDIRRWLTDTEAMENAQPRRPAIKMSSRRYNMSDEDLAALVSYLQGLK